MKHIYLNRVFRGYDLFPRLNRWGLIEAANILTGKCSHSVLFPRLNRWGLIEAIATDLEIGRGD